MTTSGGTGSAPLRENSSFDRLGQLVSTRLSSFSTSQRFIKREEELEQERCRRSLALIRNPLKPLKDGQEPDAEPGWLDLFLDLSFVAVLSTVTITHDDPDGSNVGSLIAFIVLLWWTWASRVFFGIRYGKNDILNRFGTFCYICAFAYLGGYSGAFRPFILVEDHVDYSTIGAFPNNEPEPTNDELHELGSWAGLLIVFAVGRLILGLQYLVVLLMPESRRKIHLPLILPLIGCAVSGWMAFGLHWLQATSSAQNATRLGLLYGAIAFEMVLNLVVGFLRSPVRTHPGLMLKRFALLSLVILGEGFLGLTRSISTVLSALGFNTAVFIQIFCALALFYLIWTIIFDPFDPEARMPSARTHVHSMLNLPLHITLLLWIQATIVVILSSNISEAIFATGEAFLPIQQQFYGYFNSVGGPTDLPSQPFYLQLEPDTQRQTIQFFELNGIPFRRFNQSLTAQATEINSTLASYSGSNLTEFYEYANQLIYSYGLRNAGVFLIKLAGEYALAETDKFKELAEGPFAEVYRLPSDTVTVEDYYELAASIVNAVAPAALFILPCLGGILLMTVVLTCVQRPPRDIFDHLLLIPRALLGLVLCLLGLLGIGRSTATAEDFANIAETSAVGVQGQAPIFAIFENQWLLPMQVFLLCGLIAFEGVVLYYAKRLYKRERGSVTPKQTESPEGGDTSTIVGDEEEAREKVPTGPLP